MKNLKMKAAHVVALVVMFASSACAADSPKVSDALKQRFPKLAFDSVEESPVKGIYEVVSGSNIFYFDAASGHIIFGEMWSPRGTNITAGKRAKIQAKVQSTNYGKFRDRLADAIKVGDGPHEVIEVTDPDCPYCRKMHGYWATRKDVTRYIFLMPIAQLHPGARAKADYILSASDRVAALDAVMGGKFDKEALPSVTLNRDLIDRQTALVTTSGLSGTPAFFVNGTFVNGADIPTIENLIKRSK